MTSKTITKLYAEGSLKFTELSSSENNSIENSRKIERQIKKIIISKNIISNNNLTLIFFRFRSGKNLAIITRFFFFQSKA